METLDFIEATKKIYSKLMDKESREIFEMRSMYSLTNDYMFIRKMAERYPA